MGDDKKFSMTQRYSFLGNAPVSVAVHATWRERMLATDKIFLSSLFSHFRTNKNKSAKMSIFNSFLPILAQKEGFEPSHGLTRLLP